MKRYNRTSLATAPQRRHIAPVQSIPEGEKLLSVAECAIALREVLPIGSESWIRRQIRTIWVRGVHYIRLGEGKRSRIGIYLPAVLKTIRG